MNDEIKDILMIIAKKLNKKYKVLSDGDYEKFLVDIDIYTFNDLCRFACLFLNLSIFFKTIYSGLKGEFEKLYKLLGEEIFTNQGNIKFKTLDFVREYFEDANYSAILDGHFDNYILADGYKCNRFKICIPKDQIETVLEEFYEIGADVFEGASVRDSANIGCDAIVYFNGLTFTIRTYSENKDGIIMIDRYYRSYDGIIHEYIELPSIVVEDCFEDTKGSTLIETPEYMFIDAIYGGTALDYIEAMTLKNKINLKKVAFIKSRMGFTIKREKEEKSNGLQKTIGTIVS